MQNFISHDYWEGGVSHKVAVTTSCVDLIARQNDANCCSVGILRVGKQVYTGQSTCDME